MNFDDGDSAARGCKDIFKALALNEGRRIDPDVLAALERLIGSEPDWNRFVTDDPMGAVRVLRVLAKDGDSGEELAALALTRTGTETLLGIVGRHAAQDLTRGLGDWQAAAVLAIEGVVLSRVPGNSTDAAYVCDEDFVSKAVRQQVGAVVELIRGLSFERKVAVLSSIEVLKGFDRVGQLGAYAGLVRNLEPARSDAVRESLRADVRRRGAAQDEVMIAKLDFWLDRRSRDASEILRPRFE
jgi:hypothetical protein